MLLLAAAGAAFAATPRTIVVRGHAFASDGRPLGGVRVSARGTVNASAVTDDRGRYTLSVPLGMPAALRHLPYRIEVRAEANGRRLPLSGGGQALVLEASWQASSGRVRVQSNREAAATAVSTALEVEDVTIAWIDADFGGTAKERGDGSFVREAPLPGGAPEAVPVRPAAPRNSAQAVGPEPPRIVATTRTVEAPPVPPSPVRAVGPHAKQASVPAPDTCRCVVRGTVEIGWERPLEDHTPIRVELDAPGARVAELSLFMGAPREFRFGPLPCGTWRLAVRAGGRLRYTDARGDTARVVSCAGLVETRVVLVPARR